jgi:hypothetical protein
MVVEIRHADHVALSIRKKLAITSPTSGGRSVGIVRSRTQTIEISFFLFSPLPSFGTAHAACFYKLFLVQDTEDLCEHRAWSPYLSHEISYLYGRRLDLHQV